MKKVLLLINAKSRSGSDLAAQAKTELAHRGFEVIAPDTSAGDYTELIRENKDNVDIIIAGGGDGTIRMCLEGVLLANLPFGILPLGTANNLARNIGLPIDLRAACDVIEKGTSVPIDVAFVNDVPFFNVAGLGLSVKINKSLPPDLKKRWGIFAYVIFALRVARRFRPFKAEVKVDDESFVLKTLQITVCNGKHFGAGLRIDDDATIDDSKLDIASTETKNWWQAAKALMSLLTGKTLRNSQIRKFKAHHFEIRTRKPMKLDTDGDVTVSTPAVFRIEPKRLSIFTKPEEFRQV